MSNKFYVNLDEFVDALNDNIINNEDFSVSEFDIISKKLRVEEVIVNKPHVIILWNDDTRTHVQCSKEDKFNLETGIIYAVAKKMFGNTTTTFKRAMSGIMNRTEDRKMVK